MNNVWKKIMEAIAIAIKKPDIPPIICGARGLIEKLSAVEEQISIREAEEYSTKPIENLATIAYKYGNKDIYKDIYQFIQT